MRKVICREEKTFEIQKLLVNFYEANQETFLYWDPTWKHSCTEILLGNILAMEFYLGRYEMLYDNNNDTGVK